MTKVEILTMMDGALDKAVKIQGTQYDRKRKVSKAQLKTLEKLSKQGKSIAEIARKLNLTENGFRVINNCGKDAKQSVPHIHYHILAGAEMGERIV